MAIDHADAVQLFSEGEFVELLRLATPVLQNGRSAEPRTRIIVSHALALTGQFADARTLAALDNLPSGELSIRSRAQCILGLICGAQGDMRLAAEHFHSAIGLARESQHLEQLAWAHLYLFRSLVDGEPTQAVLTLLPEVRRVVTRAGLPQLTAYLHICVAALEGNIGRLDEALRHCDTADSILELAPNAWLQGTGLLNRACIAQTLCEFDRGAEYVERARAVIRRSGHARGSWVLDNNLGHIETARGRLDRARLCFQRVMASRTVSTFGLTAAYEGMARVHLIANELDECEAALGRLDEEALRHSGLASTYHARSALLIKARLLLKRGRPDLALQILDALEDALDVVRDLPLKAAIHLVVAQAYAAKGDCAAAARRLVAASEDGATRFREVHAQHYLTAGLLCGTQDAKLGSTLSARAGRLSKSQGIGSMRAQIDASPAARVTEPDEKATPESVTDSIASLIDLAFEPRLFASELLRIVQDLKCSVRSRLVECAGGSSPDVNQCSDLVLHVGHDRGQTLLLVCEIPSDPVHAVVLSDLIRIARSALSMERTRQLEQSRTALWPASPAEERAGVLFISEEMQTLLATVRRIGPTNVPVLITGETGTGKEVLARMVHAYSNRSGRSFLPFNCGAAPKEMLDSQLFGYRRGAFTGATESFAGVIRGAAGGTILLDEIGESALEVQPKLLRFLESNEIHPFGEVHPVSVDVRVIAATNADLEALVAQRQFREDLFYRLNIVRLHIPPLRHRRVEVPAFADHYLRKYAQEFGKGDLRVAEETMEYLMLYAWPGNIRQLANEMRRLAALAEPGAILMPEHLSLDIAASRRTMPASARPPDTNEIVVRVDQPLAAAVQHVERAMIQHALQRSGGLEEAAACLGLSRKGLYLKRQRYGLELPAGRDTQVA